MLKVKKSDMVMVLSGKDKGKKGKVISVNHQSSRAIVEGINFVKKHKRRTQQDQQQHTGVMSVESPISLSNIMVICKNCDAAAKVSFSVLKDKSKVRICKKCSEVI
ncbi:MAG: 50S ribosomal protein L24 [Candidatus Omnitrophota bacterium]